MKLFLVLHLFLSIQAAVAQETEVTIKTEKGALSVRSNVTEQAILEELKGIRQAVTRQPKAPVAAASSASLPDQIEPYRGGLPAWMQQRRE